MVREIDVVVIGAGQAGLVTSYELSLRGIEHVVLDRGGVAESWRARRWDSFALNVPNWSFNLPGFPFSGPDPDAFMARDDTVSRFRAYADLINAPVERGIDVTRLRVGETGRYLLDTTTGRISARAVVVATGAYQLRHRPPENFHPSITQLHTDQYRNPTGLQDGGVLVVGAGQSGCQVAEDLTEAGRSVWVATGSCGWIPRRYRGQDNIYWRLEMGIFDDPLSELGHALRLACPPMQTGVEGGRDVNLRILSDQGMTLTGRFLGADGFKARLGDDLQASATKSDEAAVGIRTRIDAFIDDQGLEAPEEAPFRPVGVLPAPPTELDFKELGITNVIWASGFRLDYSWIDLDLHTRDGYPEQTQGVSEYGGLYFMGLQLMHTRKSGLIFGVGEDAAHVVSVLAEQLGAT